MEILKERPALIAIFDIEDLIKKGFVCKNKRDHKELKRLKAKGNRGYRFTTDNTKRLNEILKGMRK